MTAGNPRDMDAFYARASNPDDVDDDSPYLHVAGRETRVSRNFSFLQVAYGKVPPVDVIFSHDLSPRRNSYRAGISRETRRSLSLLEITSK